MKRDFRGGISKVSGSISMKNLPGVVTAVQQPTVREIVGIAQNGLSMANLPKTNGGQSGQKPASGEQGGGSKDK